MSRQRKDDLWREFYEGYEFAIYGRLSGEVIPPKAVKAPSVKFSRPSS